MSLQVVDPQVVAVTKSEFRHFILSSSSSSSSSPLSEDADSREAASLTDIIFPSDQAEDNDSSLPRHVIESKLNQRADFFGSFDWGRDFGIDNRQRVQDITNVLLTKYQLRDTNSIPSSMDKLDRTPKTIISQSRMAIVFLTDRYVRRYREQAYLKSELQLIQQCFPSYCIVIAMMEIRIKRKYHDILLELGFAKEALDQLKLVDLSDVKQSADLHATNIFQRAIHPTLNISITQIMKKIEIYSKQTILEGVKQGRVDLVKDILTKGYCQVNDVDEGGQSLLHLSVIHHQPQMMAMLLQVGADINAIDVDRNTVLHHCCRLHAIDLLTELLKHPEVKLNAANVVGCTALHIAAKLGDEAAILLLTKYKAELRLPDINGDSAADMAISEEIKSLLLTLDRDQMALLRSIQSNDEKTFNTLLAQADIDVNICNEDGRSCLFFAATGQNEDMVTALLAKGADPNQRDNWGDSPLASAAYYYDKGINIVKILLAAGSSISHKNIWGNSTFYNACQAGNTACVELMIQSYPEGVNDIGLPSSSNSVMRVIELAVLKKYNEMISLLLRSGASVDKTILEQILAMKDDVQITYEAIAINQFALWFILIQLESNEYGQHLIAKFIQSHPQLLHAKDRIGRMANAVASEKNKTIMNSFFLWHGRYRAQRTEHRSSTSYVFKGVDEHICDDNGNYLPVAIKIMRFKTHFLRELIPRQQYTFDEEFIMPVVAHYPKDEALEASPEDVGDDSFGDVPTMSKSEAEQYFCIVMPLADRNMFVSLKQERFAGSNMEVVKDILRQLLHCMKHLHDHHVLHGDIKPLNIMRLGASWKLIDLDAACRLDQDTVGLKYSSGYLPPEAIFVDAGKTAAFVKSTATLESNTTGQTFELVLAHPSFDIWSLGCVLYQLCSQDAIPLFVVGQDDNLTCDTSRDDNLFALHEWSNVTKQRKLSLVTDVLARNLLSLMLMKDPLKRPSVAQILSHPFLSGKKVVRLPNTSAKFDIFLSYRVASDLYIVEKIYDLLTMMGFKVWWDKKCLELGVDWKEGFCAGLISSRTYLCVVSKLGINHSTNARQSFALLDENSHCDNLLLEIRLAKELHQLGYLERMVPLLVGDSTEDGASLLYLPFQRDQCIPQVKNCIVHAIEESLQEHLDRQALGSSVFPAQSSAITIAGLLNHLLSSQGIILQGEKDSALVGAANQIASMLSQLDAEESNQIPSSNAATSSSVEEPSSRSHIRVVQQLKS